jgi:hypothetical protein
MGRNLRIGATVDVAEIKAGLDQTTEAVTAAAQRIPISFDEAAGRTKKALAGISDDVKATAEVISIESLKVAQATKAQAAAMAELRNATIVSKDAKLDDASTSALLAAAQQKVAASSAELAAAKRAEAESVAAAAEEESLSQNVVIRAFQKTLLAVTEASEGIREQLVETAEAGGLEAEGITAGFAGFSKLLGAGIAVGFAANYLDGLAKVNVELEHLSAKTGISIQELAGLQQILKEAGGDFETVATGLVRMESNTEKLGFGNKELAAAYTNLGLKIEDVRRAKPDELLQMIATAMAKETDANVLANSAIEIFGRGGQALIPVLREQGALLTENTKKQGELTGITDETAEAARRWTQETARLSATFRRLLLPVLLHAEDVVRSMAGGLELAGTVMQTVFEGVATAAVAALIPLKNLGIALMDLLKGNFKQMIIDAQGSSQSVAQAWKAGFADIENSWKATYRTFHDNTQLPPLPKEAGEPNPSPLAGGKKSRNAEFQRDEEELAQQRLDAAQHGYSLGLAAEIDFWKQKLAAAKKGSEEYREIVSKLASLEEQQLKADRKPQAPSSFADVLRSGDVAALNSSFAADMQEQVKTVQQAVKQETEAYRLGADEQIRLAEESYKTTEQNLAAEVRLHRMTEQERIAALRQAANQEYQIELNAIRLKEALDMNDVQKYQQDLNRELQITRQHDQQLRQLAQQTAEQTQKIWMQAYDKMTTQFNDAVAKWVVTGKGFAQSMAQMVAGITENFTKNVLKMAEQYLLGLALQKSGQKSQILADAKTAAANAYQAVVGIPYVGPVLAPAAAATAFAGVMAFDTFGEGGVVRGGGGMAVPVLAHAGERVLTPSQTQNFETLVNSRTESHSASSTINMGGLTQNFHGAKATPQEAARAMNDAIRRGRLRYA